MKKLDSQTIIDSLCEGGSVAELLPSYEPRQSQLDLMKLIIDSFNEDAHVMAEAGTGVGKSFAYLLPAMNFAIDNKEKVVISTATITLQQQLYEKDIPLVAAALGKKIKSVIMKGRGNYLCFRRLEDALREPPYFDDFDFDELTKINDWANNTKTGDRAELPFHVKEQVWSTCCSESDMCPGSHCPWREQCFVMSLRREALSAHVIVVNHHLLFADLAARYEGAGYEIAVVLPPFNRLIIDEAHTIEKSATSFFSAEFARTGILKHLGRLYHKKGRRKKGLLVRLNAITSFNIKSMAAALEDIRNSAIQLDESAMELCGGNSVYRLSDASDNDTLNHTLFPDLKTLRNSILKFTGPIHEVIENIEEEEQAETVVWEISSIIRRFEGIAEICSSFCDFRKHQDEVLWIEKQQGFKEPWASFNKTPIDLAPKLRESIFMPKKTVVCVSATLAINDDFSWWAARCGITGIQNKTLLSGCFPSPFPYSSAVLLASPTEVPLPDEKNWQAYIDNAVMRLVEISGGSALILFTSYQSLRSAADNAKGRLEPLGIKCLKQGEDDRTRLLQNFLSDTSSCLFATDSFWEGVDAPGDTLRLVIICRLPFRTPDDPVFEARSEAIQKRGGSPFMELSLPLAVTKFKQGFGRLMRRSADHGIVVVLDGRLLKKNYGQVFIQSLPETKTCFGDLEKILRDMENFLY